MSGTVRLRYRQRGCWHSWFLPLRDDDRIQKSSRTPPHLAGARVETVVKWLQWSGATNVQITRVTRDA